MGKEISTNNLLIYPMSFLCFVMDDIKSLTLTLNQDSTSSGTN